ncbi:TonB-dependent receptor [Sphingobacterium sp. SRCM116780]|uniref:TonB-dependent receptor n=1 Tax=Sphingobacterium sp. SRCM116780 TaxID=2907623 RepID=UPI001F3B8E11|nr:TonB-dependent receptor [Sphingobacterium sp. SRCM116780]UIR57142.1 TonB-dependent receptor [Sphingobacterium sp. SRCM116780]
MLHSLKSILPILFCFLFISYQSTAQSKFQYSGYVKNAANGETLIGAVIRGADATQITRTNNYGFYSIQLPAGNQSITISYVGFEDRTFELVIQRDSVLNIDMNPEGKKLEEVVVSGRRKIGNVSGVQTGLVKLEVKDIKNIPVVFGEQDVLKTIQLLPGVTSGGEGSSSFYVRGGGGDQNLILLDEAAVYNASHLFGFFSTFNSDAIKDVNFYKGGMPAYFGGKVSSVMDISMIDGNNKKFGVEGGIGLIASRLKVEGPIVKDKGSFMISGRRTYADLFLKLSKDDDVNKSKLFFYDLNAKLNYRFDDKNSLFLSGYFGKDAMAYADLFDFNWGNTTGTIRWNHVWNNKLFSNTTFIFSDFNYNVNVEDDSNFKIISKIKNFNLKQDFQYYPNNDHQIRFGLQTSVQTIRPASLYGGEGAQVNTIEIEPRKGLETAIYASDEWTISDKFKALYGIRLNNYSMLGPGTIYSFDKEGNVLEKNIYEKNELIQNYLTLEPRISLNYMFNENQSIKASFNRNSQNLHQLTNTTSSLPTDQFVLSSNNIKPQLANQVSLGYFQNFENAKYEASVEAYYKNLQNQIDFKNGADLQANELLDGELLFGKGRAYGIEWFFKKNRGKLTGWLSYTLSKSERQFDQINAGAWFNARQDKTHNVALVAMYKLTEKWTLGSTFVYYTGDAVTFPSGKYQVDGKTLFYYTDRNSYRMPNYHRLDLSATYDPGVKENKKYSSSWSFGLYNAYNRKNAYLIDFRENEDNPNITEAYRVALFGIIPSVTWNFKF